MATCAGEPWLVIEEREQKPEQHLEIAKLRAVGEICGSPACVH
jgi:hypothetical protein